VIEVDGSDGGGQLLRSSLTLAALTQQPVRIRHIRGNRPEPGLKHQHLGAVRALEQLCTATVEGAELGSEMVTFEPDGVAPRSINIDIPTAGSLALLFDTVLPLATQIQRPMSVTATGGTEVAWSPPLTAHEHVKFPLCRRFGLQSAVERHRTGFYPAGGGRATLWLAPSTLTPIDLTERGGLKQARIYSRSSADLTRSSVATRQAHAARNRLTEAGIEVQETAQLVSETASTGSALTIVLEYEHTRMGFDALGERDTAADAVADEAVSQALAAHESDAVVDRHLADQLLVCLALVGGQMRIPDVTAHVETHCALLDQFGFEIHLKERDQTALVRAPTPTDPIS
jgi:RNA 3'-terminal phosphate cyclase (ATP)